LSARQQDRLKAELRTMKLSNYSERITIQKIVASPTLNTLQEVDLEDDDNWETHFQCFARIIPRGTKEFTRAGVVDADVSHRIQVIRSSETEAITSEMRISWGSLKLSILAAFPHEEDRREIEMLTRY